MTRKGKNRQKKLPRKVRQKHHNVTEPHDILSNEALARMHGGWISPNKQFPNIEEEIRW